MVASVKRRSAGRAYGCRVVFGSVFPVRYLGMRTARTCEGCGVVFLGNPKERLCPMCKTERNRASRKAYRAFLRAHGWCYDCGQTVEEGRTRCRACLDKIAAAERKKYKKKKPVA